MTSMGYPMNLFQKEALTPTLTNFKNCLEIKRPHLENIKLIFE